MTEAEWLASTDPAPMLEFLRGTIRPRKLRLFAAGCCRRIWPLLHHQWSREVVSTAERFADGLAGEADIKQACERAELVADAGQGRSADAAQAAVEASGYYLWDYHEREPGVDGGAGSAVRASGRGDESHSQAALLRCLLGSQPFQPVTADPSWLTSTAVSLAHQMYDSRDFSPMPILADALQDAGCDHPDILAHCRGDGLHVRGCWVVDLVLEKE